MFATIQLTFANISGHLFNDVEGEGFWAHLTRFGKFIAGVLLTMLGWVAALALATAIELGGLPTIAFFVVLFSTLAAYGFIIAFVEAIFDKYNEDGTPKA
ncbi:hypothetical protein [Vibrio phage vB_VmeM-Yong XC32]|nr:hypothetical protein [Vibrio phage vB_VmeM-Yong XC31]QAX96436.1 hypothetical protein [Vibrio phage vB_VmeM-Yong XC32]QAX96753.1 hypothetical protein [Vibrio phage vB_VmeM-Yong MS31]QAX97072.1 hypothetical protein [Vibrio phage vB_VmeM-Yong MS32]